MNEKTLSRKFDELTFGKIFFTPYLLFYRLPKKCFLFIFRVFKIIKLSKDADERTLYQYEKRHHKIVIFYELLRWYFKYGSVNHRFYDYGFDRKSLKNKAQYIGTKEFEELRDKRNNGANLKGNLGYNYKCLVRDKFVFSRFMSCFSIPVVKTLAIIDKESLQLIGTDFKTGTREYFNNSEREIDVFCKPIDGGKGEGLFALKCLDKKLFINNDEISVNNFIKKLGGRYILQERITQHSLMHNIYPHSVNTLRIVTYHYEGSTELFMGALRMGTGGSNVDNLSAGGIAVGIDLERGKLFKKGFHSKKGNPEFIESHPDSGIKFEDIEIPWFQETKKILLKAHGLMNGVHSIGWDVAIAPLGPVIIEANDGWGCKIFMVTNKNFKEKLYRIFH